MKMSEVFTLPVDVNEGFDEFYIQPCHELHLLGDHAKAAAHAINQHDQLTAINQELVEALENTLGSLGDEFALCGYVIEDIEKAIKRAKELTNEG